MAHNLESFPVLHTSRLHLVEMCPGHAADLFGIFTNSKVTEHYPVVPLHDIEDILHV